MERKFRHGNDLQYQAVYWFIPYLISTVGQNGLRFHSGLDHEERIEGRPLWVVV